MSTMPSLSLRPARGTRRTWAVALSLSLLAEPLVAHASGPAARPASIEDARAQARALTEQGQASFDAGDYRAAAASWRRILDVLPEDTLNREERENALLIALEAYKHEFRQAQAVKGAAAAEDVTRLREALLLCKDYAAELQRVYGPQGTVDGAVFESRSEIERMLAEAGAPAESPVLNPVVPGPQLERAVVDRGPSGTGLIAAGASTIVVGLAMMPLVIIGARDLRQANEDLDAAEDAMDPDAARADAEDRKQTANAMLISGSVLMGVLTAGGATMLGIGIRRRVRYMAVSPTLGPTYVGVGIRGRF